MQNKSIKRFKEILEEDRLMIGGDCKNAIISDLESLFGSYFSVKEIKVEIQSNGKGFYFIVKVNGEDFKSFRSTNAI